MVCRGTLNRFAKKVIGEGAWTATPASEVLKFHESLPGYEPTPLVGLPELSKSLGLKNLWVKDESKRFGLNAFKVLGASFAIHRFLEEHEKSLPPSATGAARPPFTFATATDGNHGRAVAWSARRLGHQAKIFVPNNMVAERRNALLREGAEVIEVAGTYDDTVSTAASRAAQFGWQVISDTAYPGYLQIPRWIMEGYGTLFLEASRQLKGMVPDVVVLQAGVGGLCCAESAMHPSGELSKAKGGQDSIMAGLNCGTPSLIAWPVIRNWYDAFVAVDDIYAKKAMRALARASPAVVSGESGAAGLAGLMAFRQDPSLAALQALVADKNVLIISTEGDTDPIHYHQVLDEKE